MSSSRLSNSPAVSALTGTGAVMGSGDSFRGALEKAVGDTGLFPQGSSLCFPMILSDFWKPVVDSGILPTHISVGCCRSWDDCGSAHTGQPVAVYHKLIHYGSVGNTTFGSPCPLWAYLRQS